MNTYHGELKIKEMEHPDEQKRYNKRKKTFFSTHFAVVLVCVAFGITPVLQAQNSSTGAGKEVVHQDSLLEKPLTGFIHESSIFEIRNYGDYTINDALMRVPGVQVSRDKELNFRGTGYQNFALQFNGQRLANTGLGNRAYDLEAFSADPFSSIEVIKVPDASMDADALGGIVNLKSSKPAAGKRTVSAIAGGGADVNYINRSGPGMRGWANYAEQFTDAFALNVNISYQQEHNGLEELQREYGTADFGSGPVDVLNSLAPSLQIDSRNRLTGTVQTNFTPTKNDRYYVNALLADQSRRTERHRDVYAPNGGWVTQDSASQEEGTFTSEAALAEIHSTTFAFQAGGEHERQSLILSYQAGISHGNTEQTDYLFPFGLEGFNYAVDMSDRKYPQIDITNRETQVLDDGTVDRQFLIAETLNRAEEEHKNTQYNARFDVELPIGIGTVKTGVSARISNKDGEYTKNYFEYNRTLRMISFNMLREPNRNIDVVNGNYRIPWFVNTSHARAFLEDQRPVFTGNPDQRAYESAIRNYDASENIYGFYGLGDLEFGALTAKIGGRVEYTSATYEGQRVTFDEQGSFLQTQPTEASDDYLEFYPNVQLMFKPSNHFNIQAAYSRTISRPNYHALTPFERVDNQDSLIFKGNARLSPVFSDNMDVSFAYRTGSSGLISIAGFYKSLSDFVVLREQTLDNGFAESSYTNSSTTAAIYGVEVNAEQNLTFLPGLLSHAGILANYTFTQSDYETDQRSDIAYPGQSPHVVNAALRYHIGRFEAQVSYHWSDDILAEVAGERTMAPSISGSPVYLDRYENGYQDVSATAEFQLSERFRAWVNVRNILNFDQLRYAENISQYPTSTYVRDGLDVRIGVRFDL